MDYSGLRPGIAAGIGVLPLPGYLLPMPRSRLSSGTDERFWPKPLTMDRRGDLLSVKTRATKAIPA